MSQGKNLTPEQKQAIVQVKKFMDAERSRGESVSTKKPAIRTANALGFSISTVKNVLSGVQKRQGQIFDPPKIKGHRKAKIDSYQITFVRKMIQNAHFRSELVTVPKLLFWLEEKGITATYSSLRRGLLIH